MVEKEGQLQKRIQEKALRSEHDLFYHRKPSLVKLVDVKEIVGEMRKDLDIVDKLMEIVAYIKKNSVKIQGATPIFSARYFSDVIEQHIEALKKWLGEDQQ